MAIQLSSIAFPWAIIARINCDKYTIAAKTIVATDMDMNVCS